MDRTTWGILFISFLCFLAIGAVVSGVWVANFIIKNGYCGHPQCQPSARNSRRGYLAPAVSTDQLPKIKKFANMNEYVQKGVADRNKK